MWIRARWIVPVSSPPIENGWVEIKDGVIVKMGHTIRSTRHEAGGTKHEKHDPASCFLPPASGEALDLGNVVLLPGLINCHAHLEFERGAHPRDSFAAWVRSVQTGEKHRPERALQETYHRNLQRLLQTGCTTIVNHCNTLPPETCLVVHGKGENPLFGVQAISGDPHGLGGREASAAPPRPLENKGGACSQLSSPAKSHGVPAASPAASYERAFSLSIPEPVSIEPTSCGGWHEQTFGHGRALARLTKGLVGDRTRRCGDRELSPRLIHICEIVGSNTERAAESYRKACERRLKLLESDACEEATVCPTSPYAVAQSTWKQFLANRDPEALLSIHIKESAEEQKLYHKEIGGLASLIRERGGELWQHDPVAVLKNEGLLRPRTLLIHGNYLNDADLRTLQGTGVSVIHCPGSHAYFGHQRFPLELVREYKINIALGTDSLASNEDLSMLGELRLAKENYPELSWEELVTMATLNGAKALGVAEQRGSIEVGKEADLIAVTMQNEQQSPWEAIAEAEEISFIYGL